MTQTIQQITPDDLSQLKRLTMNADESARRPAMSSRVVDRLFDRLVAEFDHKFASKMPDKQAEDDLKAIWAERLNGLTVEDIRKGIDQLPAFVRRSDGWPPGAAEFRELCRPHREPYERAEFQKRALTQDPADKTVAQSHIDKMRGRMGAVE
jgi:hypothetical protein